MDGEERNVARECPLAEELADRIRSARDTLSRRWVGRVARRVAIRPEGVFPSRDLETHVSLLISGLADHLENPTESLDGEVPVVAEAMALGELRHQQGFEAHEILKEYEILGGILFDFLIREVDAIQKPCTRSELMACAHRLARGLAVVQQVTLNHYLLRTTERVREREQRLRSFNRTVSHELKNHVAALLGAGDLLDQEWISAEERTRLNAMVRDNAKALQALLENLLELSRIEAAVLPTRGVPLLQAVIEAVRQHRRLASQRGVAIRIADDLPDEMVNAAVIETCVSNYVSNAVKYSDPSKPERWVEIRGRLLPRPAADEPPELEIEVRDNGIGVPPDERGHLFHRFFRGGDRDSGRQEGTGLGLSIVRETVETLGGRAWAQFREDGSSFFFAIPLEGPTARTGDDETGTAAAA